MAVLNGACYGYYATPRSGLFVLRIGIVPLAGDAQLQSWYLARGSVRSSLGELKGAASWQTNGNWDLAKKCDAKRTA
jgi:hypothetical protein